MVLLSLSSKACSCLLSFFLITQFFFFFPLNMVPIIFSIFIPPDSFLTFSLLRSFLTLLDIYIFPGIYTANYWACFWSWKEGWWERWHLADNPCTPSQGNSTMSLALFLPLEVQKHGHASSSRTSVSRKLTCRNQTHKKFMLLFSQLVMSNSLSPYGLKHARPPCVPHHLLKFAQVHVHCTGDALHLSHPPMPSSPSALNLSHHQGLFQESAVCIRWPKYWSFSFGISPSKEYSGLISLKIDWFDLLAVQGTLKSVWKHQFFSTQPSLWSSSCIHAWLLEKP